MSGSGNVIQLFPTGRSQLTLNSNGQTAGISYFDSGTSENIDIQNHAGGGGNQHDIEGGVLTNHHI